MLDGDPDPPWEEAILRGEGSALYTDYCPCAVVMRLFVKLL